MNPCIATFLVTDEFLWKEFSTFATVVCLAGTILNVKMNILCFYAWCLGNILWLIFDLSLGFHNRAALDVVQFCMAVWGIVSWHEKQHKEKQK